MIIICRPQARSTTDLANCVHDLSLTKINRHHFFFEKTEIFAAIAGYRLECRSKWDFKHRLCKDRWRRLGELISGCSNHNTDFISQALPLSQTHSYSLPENIVISAVSLSFSCFKAISLWYLAFRACVYVCLPVYSPGCSLESKDLSGLKVIPMSHNSMLDTHRHTKAEECWCFFFGRHRPSLCHAECLNGLVFCLEGCLPVIHCVSLLC